MRRRARIAVAGDSKAMANTRERALPKPFRRDVLHPTFGCVALTARGARCGRPHWCELSITFEWNPVTGKGVGGPSATFCRTHDYVWDLEPADRVEVVGGWLGRAWNPSGKCWTVMTTVYESRAGVEASLHWWALRRPTTIGDCRRETYDQAIRRLA